MDKPDGNKERLTEKARQSDGQKAGQTRHKYRNSSSDRDRLECKEKQKYRDSYSDRDRLECKERVPAKNAPLLHRSSLDALCESFSKTTGNTDR